MLSVEMTCPECAAPLPGAPALCPRCGSPILEDDRTIPIAFEGDTLEFAGWLVLCLLSALLIVPLAWTVVGMARWFCRNLRLRGKETVSFEGTGGELLVWIFLLAVLPVPVIALAVTRAPKLLYVPFAIAISFLIPMVHLLILRWIASRLVLTAGPTLRFDGSYWGYFGYQVLLSIVSPTVIGWAWVLAPYYRWLADHTRGEGIRVRCGAGGWDILWRTAAASIGSVPLVTIPWMCVWYARWLVSCISFTRGVTEID